MQLRKLESKKVKRLVQNYLGAGLNPDLLTQYSFYHTAFSVESEAKKLL